MSSSLFYCEAEEPYGHHRRHLPEPESHFLAACSMCRRPLGVDRDIFMYKGIDAFCSEECRQKQIQIDSRPPWRPKKTGWDLSASFRALRKSDSGRREVLEAVFRHRRRYHRLIR